jgi:hypothetical protein
MVEGPEATREVVLLTLSDLQNQPFNPDGLSLGDLTYRVSGVVNARILQALRRLGSLIVVNSVTETVVEDDREYEIIWIDRESRTRRSETING